MPSSRMESPDEPARETSHRVASLAAAAGVAGVVLLLFAPILAGRCLLGGDMAATFEPLASALADGLERGDVLRTQRLFNGLPLLAHPVVAAAYPPQLVLAFLAPAPAVSLLSLLHLAAAGAGVVLFLRRLGATAGAAAAGGVVLALAGPAAASMLQPNLVRALAWLPWMLVATLAASRPVRGRGLAGAAALAVVTAMLLLTAEPFVALPALAGVLLLLMPRDGEAWRTRIRPALLVGASLAIGALLAAPLLVPGLIYARETVRAAGFTAAAAGEWSLHPGQALGLVVPRPFGDPRLAGPDGFAATALVPGRSSEYFRTSYLGALALGLAAAGLACGGRRERLAAAAAALLVLLALGAHGPARALVGLPGLDMLRYPVKWLLPALLPLAVLVAAGARAVAEAGGAGRRARGIVVASAIPPAIVALLAAPLASWVAGLAPEVLSAQARTIVEAQARARLVEGGTWSALAPLVLLGAVAVLRRRGLPQRVPVAAALLLALDLGAQQRRDLPTVTAAHYAERAAATRLLLDETPRQRTWVDAPFLRRQPPVDVPRTLEDMTRWQRELMLNYTPSSAGIALAFPVDIEALSPRRIGLAGDLVARSAWRERLMLLGAAGVTHVVTMDPAAGGDLAVPIASIRTRAAAPLVVLRNRLALPRARVAPAARIVPDEEAHERILADAPLDFFARWTLVTQPDWEAAHPHVSPPAQPDPGWQGTARIVAEPAGGLDVVVEGDGGILVVSDAWIPGLRATIDGESAPVFPADIAFTGIRVAAGAHVVRIRYHPWSR